MSSRREPHGAREALELAKRAATLIAVKGTSARRLDLRKGVPREEILSLMLGPTGGLRAPTFLAGDTLYVGFPKEGFAELE